MKAVAISPDRPYIAPAAMRDILNASPQRPGAKGCRIWTGPVSAGGYGCFSLTLRTRWTVRIAAHRAALWLKTGVYSDTTRYACHHCDTPACFAEDHLYLGSAAENYRDRMRRHKYTARVWTPGNPLIVPPKLSDEQVAQARRRFFGPRGNPLGKRNLTFGVTCNTVAREFGISKTAAIRALARSQCTSKIASLSAKQRKKLDMRIATFEAQRGHKRNVYVADSCYSLAREYAVGTTVMKKALWGETYKHVPMPPAYADFIPK